MIAVTATELQSRTGAIIDQALTDPVRVTRNRRSVAVLISAREYERLTALEDSCWGQMADIAVKTESVSPEDIKKLLEKLG